MTLEEAFRFQSRACAELGSPFMARLMALAAERLDTRTAVGRRLANWPGEVSPSGDSLPLRLAGALHALKLEGDPVLAAVYPPHEVADDALWEAVASAMERRAEAVLAWLESAPQTNEVRRSAGILAAAAVVLQTYGLPLAASELGASAGLNLMFDRFALKAGDVVIGAEQPVLTLTPAWEGPRPPEAEVVVTERRGVDVAPLDPGSAEGRLRLKAYLWADQPDRMRLTEAASEVAAAVVDRADAVEWLAARLAPVPGAARFVFHTVAWQYFPAAAQARGEALLAAAGAAATRDAPLARFSMEGDGDARGAALTLDLWPPGERIALGRMDFHGRWVDWRHTGPR